MAQYYLINTVLVGGVKLLAGDLIDDAITNTAPIIAAGGLLWPASDPTIAAAALAAQNAHKNRGANEAELNEIMTAAVDSVQKASDATTVSNTRTISTTAPITGGGDLTADRTIAISAATTLAAGSMSAADKAKVDIAVLNTRTISTTAPITGGGDLTADRTIAISAATSGAAGSMSAVDKAKLDTVQHGTGVLVAGVSAAIAANITANSRIVATRIDPLLSVAIGHMSALSADRVVGAPGSFKITALTAAGVTETNDVSTFDWHVIN